MKARQLMTCVMLIATLATTGCASPSSVTYIPAGGSYTAADLADALVQSDPGAAERVEVEDAADVRQEALADLRKNGEDAAALADTLTADFPVDVVAVPYAVELGTFEGEPAWLVFEAWGETEGELVYRRVWVYSVASRALLAAHSVR